MSKPLKPYSLLEEEAIRAFWKKEGIVSKVRERASKQKKKFFFMDGPPYASGHIHMGTALNKILKDVTIRHKRMQGFHVHDQPGYDTHGVPIEVQVEKELKINNKKQIEEYGVEQFVEKCRAFATQYIEVMNREFENLGVWMDWENPYLTLDNTFIEAMWHTFRKAEEKKRLYLGKYPVQVCPRCETAVAYNEVEYVKQTDTSIYVKFPVRGRVNTFLIIWTTTPWTLPGNTGVMVHPKYDYVEAVVGKETWIVAKERLQELMDAVEAGFTVQKTVKGAALEGTLYENPLAKQLKLPEDAVKGGYRVILSERYVNLEEGSGLVHTAPGHGKEDFDAGKEAGLPAISPVEMNGVMNVQAGKYEGGKAREVDREIISDLKKGNYLVFQHQYTHDYPVCWRCKTPLLMMSTPQWFFKVGDIHANLLKMNEEVQWVPGWGKDRFRNWLENIGDWPVSRARYWGTPLPIWVCEKCGKREVIGSRAELQQRSGYKGELDLHRPYIDKITFPCTCTGSMKRVPEVMDVWIDSGVASWGSLGYPGQKKLFSEFWPAAVNIEGKDQIRGWWNSQLITAALCFNRKPFESIVMHGMVLDVSKKKMSKSQGNIVTPQEVLEKYNRDFLRYFLVSASRGEDVLFSWDSFREIARFFNVVGNTYQYANLYLNPHPENAGKIEQKNLAPEDQWMLSRLHHTLREIKEQYNAYQYFKIPPLLERVVLEDLSRTYIKLIRERVGSTSGKAVQEVMQHSLMNILQVLAPIAPHLSEYLYQQFREEGMEETIHLFPFPEADEKWMNPDLEKTMEIVQELAQAVLRLREENHLRLRWKLKEVVVCGIDPLGEAASILARMTNVDSVKEARNAPKGRYASMDLGENSVFLNLEADNARKEEWELAELTRKIQEMRKKEKMNPKNIVTLEVGSSDPGFVQRHRKAIETATSTKVVEGTGKQEKVLDRDFYLKLKW